MIGFKIKVYSVEMIALLVIDCNYVLMKIQRWGGGGGFIKIKDDHFDLWSWERCCCFPFFVCLFTELLFDTLLPHYGH